MRIVGGTFGGRRFSPPARIPARPTTEVAKEGLFNMLQNSIDLDGIKTLDIFGGTGSITYELASRGAADMTLVERDPSTHPPEGGQGKRIEAGNPVGIKTVARTVSEPQLAAGQGRRLQHELIEQALAIQNAIAHTDVASFRGQCRGICNFLQRHQSLGHCALHLEA